MIQHCPSAVSIPYYHNREAATAVHLHVHILDPDMTLYLDPNYHNSSSLAVLLTLVIPLQKSLTSLRHPIQRTYHFFTILVIFYLLYDFISFTQTRFHGPAQFHHKYPTVPSQVSLLPLFLSSSVTHIWQN